MVVSTAGTGAHVPEGTSRLTWDQPDQAWVDAGPFRAHLRHLMSVGSLDLVEVAVVVGLPTRAVRHLLEGRAGRPPRRISPHTARCLLRVRPDDVRELRSCLAPTRTARASLGRLRASGWSDGEVTAAVGFAVEELGAVEHRAHCNRLLAVRLVGLSRRLPDPLDGDDDPDDVDDLSAVAAA